MSSGQTRVGQGDGIVITLIVLAIGCLVTGLLRPHDAGALAARTAPVLGFVVAITIVAELARDAAVFDRVAQHLGRWGRGRVIVLWMLVVVLAVLSTTFLSLDTTAVILTPVVVLLAQSIAIPALPFAMATVWLANTASLLLPVSNLTNLLAARTIGPHPAHFVALSWAPALAGIVVPVAILTIAYRRVLFAPYRVPPRQAPGDPVLFWAAAIVLVVLLPLLALTADVWIPATVAAVLLVILFAVRRPGTVGFTLVPWRALGIAGSLFVLFETGHAHGLDSLVSSLVGHGHHTGELIRIAGVGALAANGINNLPAYLVLEPAAAGDPVTLMALLIGVNLGPLVSPWASLATLLWHQRLATLGLTVRWGSFAAWGLIAATPTVLLAVLALAVLTR